MCCVCVSGTYGYDDDDDNDVYVLCTSDTVQALLLGVIPVNIMTLNLSAMTMDTSRSLDSP